MTGACDAAYVLSKNLQREDGFYKLSSSEDVSTVFVVDVDGNVEARINLLKKQDLPDAKI